MKHSTLRIGWTFIGAWLTWAWMSGHTVWFLCSAIALFISAGLAAEDWTGAWEEFKHGWFD